MEGEAVRQAIEAEVAVGVQAEFGSPPKIYVEQRVVRGVDPSAELLDRIIQHAVDD